MASLGILHTAQCINSNNYLPPPFSRGQNQREHLPTQTQLITARYLVDEADGRSLAAVQEVNVDDLQLLQSNVEGLEFTVVPVQWDDLEEPVVQPQTNHPAFGVNDSNDASL